MKNYLINEPKTACKYVPSVKCKLANRAPECDMLCELNEEAKKLISCTENKGKNNEELDKHR